MRFCSKRYAPIALAFAIAVPVSAVVAWFVTPPKGPDGPTVARLDRPPLPSGSYPAEPLAPGTVAPDFDASGWLNGAPARRGTPGVRLTLVDIWSSW